MYSSSRTTLTSSGPDFFLAAAAAGLAAGARLEGALTLALGLLAAAVAVVAVESALDVFDFFEAADFLAAAACSGGGALKCCFRRMWRAIYESSRFAASGVAAASF